MSHLQISTMQNFVDYLKAKHNKLNKEVCAYACYNVIQSLALQKKQTF